MVFDPSVDETESISEGNSFASLKPLPTSSKNIISLREINQFAFDFNNHLVFHPQPSTFNLQPSTLNLQSSTFNPQSSTLNPQSSILNLQPSTLNLQSSIFNLQSLTFNLQPSTFNLQSSIFNPQPSIFNRQPSEGVFFALALSGFPVAVLGSSSTWMICLGNQ